jgi:hypothetical protein
MVDIAVRDEQIGIIPLDHFSQGIHVHRIPKAIARKRVLAFPYDDAIALPSSALNQRNVRGEAGNSSFAECGTVEGMGGQCNSPQAIEPPGGFRAQQKPKVTDSKITENDAQTWLTSQSIANRSPSQIPC